MDNLPFFKVGEKTSYEFEPPDEKNKWKKLKKQLGSNWKYYDATTNPLVTNLNELGYRSNTVYPVKNYYLALGCSTTFGQYLHEQDMYSNIIEKHTNTPVINLGISGASPMVIFANIAKLFYSDYPKPKKVFIQWPEQNRFTTFTDESNGYRPRLITPQIPEEDVFKFLIKGNSLETMAKFCYEMTHAICNVPIIEFAVWNQVAEFFNVTEIGRVDKARDHMHCGTETNKKMADFILGKIYDG